MHNWKRLALMVPVGLLLFGGAVRADTVPSGMYGDYSTERNRTERLGYREIFDPDVYTLDEWETTAEDLSLSGGTYRFRPSATATVKAWIWRSWTALGG
ncbi:hypothetical protein [Deinococcus apachensis]|uniref:hypothetical protein n=1 Tax=Deinococcus apachensis TaxID=309886 RepID=UPI00037FAF4B|nr:hypothetical protein [Deinococcus apachensis]